MQVGHSEKVEENFGEKEEKCVSLHPIEKIYTTSTRGIVIEGHRKVVRKYYPDPNYYDIVGSK